MQKYRLHFKLEYKLIGNTFTLSVKATRELEEILSFF